MSSSNCCFLTCIQISQEADQVVWYSHLFQNFPQFIVIHTVKGFGIVNKAEIDIFLELSCFFYDPADVGNLISGSSAFSKTTLNIRKFRVHILLKPGLENFEHCFASMCEISRIVQYFAHSLALTFFETGLIARAHGGFLYIDEVNLLEDHLVDLLLDVAASGVNVVEREGLSVRHP